MGTTADLGLPYMENTDPLANVAAAIQALAQAVDDVVPARMTRGQTTASTDASGDITINHGLAAVPTAVLVTNGNATAAYVVAAWSFTATQFKVRIRLANTGAVVASSAGFVLNWMAIA